MPKLQRLEVASSLGEVNILKAFDSLELHNQNFLNQQIKSVLAYLLPSVIDRKLSLALKGDSGGAKLDLHSSFVDALQITGAKVPMNCDPASDHFLRQALQLQIHDMTPSYCGSGKL